MELGVVEFEVGGKTYKCSVIESQEDIANDIDFYMYKADVRNLENGLKKAGKESIDEKIFQFAIDKNVLKRK